MRNLIQLYRDPAVVVDPPAAVTPPVVTPPVVTPPVVTPPAVTPPVVDTAPKSVSSTVDINANPSVTPPAFVVPEAFKDKPYMKGIDSLEKLFTMLDGAQTLIGSKGPQIPKADAPQAEKDAYYESIGRPKTAAEYTPVLTGADKTDPKTLPKLQAAFHKAGLTPDQAKIVWDESTTAFAEFAKDKGLADAAADIDFNKLATDNFGVDRDKVLARGKELITANLSPTMKPAIEKLDNNALIVIADLMRNMDKKYIKPDGAPNAQPVLNSGTPDTLRAKARELMVEQGKHPPMSAEFMNLQGQIDGIYETIRRGTK